MGASQIQVLITVECKVLNCVITTFHMKLSPANMKAFACEFLSLVPRIIVTGYFDRRQALHCGQMSRGK